MAENFPLPIILTRVFLQKVSVKFWIQTYKKAIPAFAGMTT